MRERFPKTLLVNNSTEAKKGRRSDYSFIYRGNKDSCPGLQGATSIVSGVSPKILDYKTLVKKFLFD